MKETISMKMMKQFALLAVCALALGAVAQQNPPAKGDDQGRPRRGMASVEDQLKTLTERLNLTADQQAKIKPILEDTHAQWSKIQQDEALSREDKMAKMRSVHDAASAKVRDLLTDEQKKKFDDWQKEHMGHGEGQGHGSGSGSGTPK